MAKLQLSVAMGDYDRTRALFDGRARDWHAPCRTFFPTLPGNTVGYIRS